MPAVRLSTTDDNESLYVRITEYGKNRRYIEGWVTEFTVKWSFLLLACSRLSPEELVRLYHTATSIRERRINKAYDSWNTDKEMVP